MWRVRWVLEIGENVCERGWKVEVRGKCEGVCRIREGSAFFLLTVRFLIIVKIRGKERSSGTRESESF